MKDLKNKLNLQGIINDVKSMINPVANTPDPDPSNAVGLEIAKLSVMVQELQSDYQAQAKKLALINESFNKLYQHLEASTAAGDQAESEPDATQQQPPSPQTESVDGVDAKETDKKD